MHNEVSIGEIKIGFYQSTQKLLGTYLVTSYKKIFDTISNSVSTVNSERERDRPQTTLINGVGR